MRINSNAMQWLTISARSEKCFVEFFPLCRQHLGDSITKSTSCNLSRCSLVVQRHFWPELPPPACRVSPDTFSTLALSATLQSLQRRQVLWQVTGGQGAAGAVAVAVAGGAFKLNSILMNIDWLLACWQAGWMADWMADWLAPPCGKLKAIGAMANRKTFTPKNFGLVTEIVESSCSCSCNLISQCTHIHPYTYTYVYVYAELSKKFVNQQLFVWNAAETLNLPKRIFNAVTKWTFIARLNLSCKIFGSI